MNCGIFLYGAIYYTDCNIIQCNIMDLNDIYFRIIEIFNMDNQKKNDLRLWIGYLEKQKAWKLKLNQIELNAKDWAVPKTKFDSVLVSTEN